MKMLNSIGMVLLGCTILSGHGTVLGQAKDAAKTERTERPAVTKSKSGGNKDKGKTHPTKSGDPVVGKTKGGRPVYEGTRGGFYYLTERGSKSYVHDFVGAKIVGKTSKGLPIYESQRGDQFYYSTSGEKVFVKK